MDVQAIDQSQATAQLQPSGQSAATTPSGQLPAFPAATGSPQALQDETLHKALSQLVGNGANVSVQFRVVGQNEIVTVFTNAETGQVITQFPPESMVLIAQFFNKLAGATLDRTA